MLRLRHLLRISLVLGLLLFSCENFSFTKIEHSTQVPANYTLVFNDEFEDSGLPDSDKWFFETWGNAIGWGNGEIQQYKVADLDNAYQANGKLNIVALKEPVEGLLWDDGERLAHTYDYSSARLVHYFEAADNPKFEPKTYGFIEVRAKIPGVGGTWPAIWLAGNSYQWPKGGEIDIMEQWGTDSNIGGNFHTWSSHNPYNELIKHYAPNDIFNSFHNYQLLWTPDKLTIMIDGNLVNTYEKDTSLVGDASINQWPFDTPQHLILNLAIQGRGVTVDDTKFPVKFEIDYVRWYQEQ